jgi:DNA-binding NarL/FixJ family response regulator
VIRVLCVDDHALLRSGIETLLSTQSDMKFVGGACTGSEGLLRYRELRPDVTLMDLQMPDMTGLDAIIAIRREDPNARIIVFTTYSGDVLAQRALKAGAQAYVLKSLMRSEILNTIRRVCAGEMQVQPEVANGIAVHMGSAQLTAREVEVLSLIACGFANKVIAARLGINEETAKTHIKSILTKLHVKDRTHAVTVGFKRGIISL